MSRLAHHPGAAELLGQQDPGETRVEELLRRLGRDTALLLGECGAFANAGQQVTYPRHDLVPAQ